MYIKFLDSSKRIEEKEKRSKLLDPSSKLYGWLASERKRVEEEYKNVDAQRMDFHIELIKKDEEPTEKLLVSRAQELEGKEISIDTKKLVSKTYLIPTPEIMGYGETHITIVHFSETPTTFALV